MKEASRLKLSHVGNLKLASFATDITEVFLLFSLALKRNEGPTQRVRYANVTILPT